LHLQNEILKLISIYQNHIQDNIKILQNGHHSLLEKYDLLLSLYEKNEIEYNEDEFFEIYEYITEDYDSVAQMYQKTFYKKLPSSAHIQKFQEKLNAKKQQQEQIVVQQDYDSKLDEFKGSAKKIMDFCKIPQDEQSKVLTSLNQLKKLKTPLESDSEIRKLKRPVIETFWKAYVNAFLQYKKNRGNVPKYITLFLLYGFFDDEFLETQQIFELSEFIDNTNPLDPDFSILNSVEWLNLIYEKKELPSISELGETYFDFLKQNHQEYSKAKKLEDIPIDIDTQEQRVIYEVKNFFNTNTRLVSGSPLTFFPVLTKFHFTSPKISELFVTKEKLSSQLLELLKIDFSAFYREMVLNDENLKIFKEFIMVNVYPHMILLPVAGSKSMMWQDLEDPRKKDTRARLVFPILNTGDLFQMVIEAVGAFRWEILRTILGHDYNNIGMPSLTSEYLDYVQFYHKNRDLSEEQKEKIKEDFKNFRDDRQKFVHDYTLWIKYESQGILKLNKVVRNIFYRYIPFSREIRSFLQNQPAYAEIHNRFRNIRTKKLTELENRWRKYGTKDTWPKVLKNTYEYFSS
ncbi:MAG: hypothetical protein NZ853_09515, partial [Leptospiraceae bacterium]|nr:hypothetical protein [Leptospiraceae bacterium]